MVSKKNILLTAFCGSSSDLLLKNTEIYETLILPNDKIKDSIKLIDMILMGNYDYIISFGQKPNIKNKVHIETKAKNKEVHICTNFDCEKLELLFKQSQVASKISHNAGTSFCNELYLNGLKYIYQKQLDTKMVFVHIPFELVATHSRDFSRELVATDVMN